MKLLKFFPLTLAITAAFGLMSHAVAQDQAGKQDDQTPKSEQQSPKSDATKQEDAAKKGDSAPKQETTKQDDSKKQETGTTGQATENFTNLMTQWKEQEAKLKALEAEFVAARVLRRDEIRDEYNEILDKANELVPDLRRSAIAAYEKKPNEDESLVRLLVGMLTDDLKNKRYDAFFKLGETLTKGKCDIKHFLALNDSKRLVEPFNATQFGQFRFSEFIKELIARHNDALKGDLPRVVIKTSRGDIEIELFEDVTPNHVANFISLTEKKYYDGSLFHRVNPAERGPALKIAQGGIPADGKKIDYTIAEEWSNDGRRKHFKGMVAAARLGGQNNSASSEFYIATDDVPSLDMPLNSYTVFGRVISGFEFARQLKEGDKMLSVEVVRKRDHEYKPVPYTPEDPKGAESPKKTDPSKTGGASTEKNSDPAKEIGTAPTKEPENKSDSESKEDKK